MGRLRTYHCDDCGGAFELFHHSATEPPPRFCLLCGAGAPAADQSLAAPALLGDAARNVDGVVRAMEEGAAFRAARIQDDFGVSPGAAASLRQTDVRDGLRPGESSFVPANNAVTKAMAAMAAAAPALPPMVGQITPERALEYSAGTRVGGSPNAGMRAAQHLRAAHSREGNVTTEAPALETLSPLYERRL